MVKILDQKAGLQLHNPTLTQAIEGFSAFSDECRNAYWQLYYSMQYSKLSHKLSQLLLLDLGQHVARKTSSKHAL